MTAGWSLWEWAMRLCSVLTRATVRSTMAATVCEGSPEMAWSSVTPDKKYGAVADGKSFVATGAPRNGARVKLPPKETPRAIWSFEVASSVVRELASFGCDGPFAPCETFEVSISANRKRNKSQKQTSR